MIVQDANRFVDRACDSCGLIHRNGVSWHGRCYNCGGDLSEYSSDDYKLTAVTPKGIEIYEPRNRKP